MSIKQRVKDFIQLGKVLSYFGSNKPWSGYELGLTEQEFDDINELITKHRHTNGWFEKDQIKNAMLEWGKALTQANLNEWIEAYNIPDSPEPKKIGVIMAGNIPLVGFHDFLTVLISGNILIGKLSSDANVLLPALSKILIGFDKSWQERIIWKDGKLEGYDAIIATGSNNTARYFEYYFKNVPNIIRKNRTGIAILSGEETPEELKLLGKDIFQYFGLGCRNISKVFVPKDFVLDRLFEAIYDYNEIANHNKYGNNYDYHRAIFLMNKEPFLENGFISFREVEEGLSSPVGVLHYERYDDYATMIQKVEQQQEDIQCIISKNHIAFGEGQSPKLSDYADGVDTLDFILSI